MNTHIDFVLNDEELTRVQRAMQYDERKDVRVRALAIHLLHLGHKPATVGEMVGVSRNSVYTWHRSFRTGGIDALHDKAGRGRKRKATAQYIEALHRLLATSPSLCGYTFSVWTKKRLGAHLAQETGIQLSDRALQELLTTLGYVYRRPKHTLKQLQDPRAVAAAKENLAELKGGACRQALPGRQGTTSQVQSDPTSSSLWTRRPST